MTRKSQAAATRAAAKKADEKTPDQIKLTEMERLQSQNVHLKKQQLEYRQRELNEEAAALGQEELALKATIEKRLKIPDLLRYRFNPETGVGNKVVEDLNG